MPKKKQNIRVLWVIGLLLLSLAGCHKNPQPVRHLGPKNEPDSLLMAQMLFNQQMASAADRQCIDYVTKNDLQYTQDEFGFWYSKTISTQLDSLTKGQKQNMHIQIYELNDSLLADIKESFEVGANSLPLAINRSLKIMRKGETMQMICPWYTAYGVEGTSLIKPYSNLKIVVRVGE